MTISKEEKEGKQICRAHFSPFRAGVTASEFLGSVRAEKSAECTKNEQLRVEKTEVVRILQIKKELRMKSSGERGSFFSKKFIIFSLIDINLKVVKGKIQGKFIVVEVHVFLFRNCFCPQPSPLFDSPRFSSTYRKSYTTFFLPSILSSKKKTFSKNGSKSGRNVLSSVSFCWPKSA